ncbi:MAG: hypothetical protein R3291_02695 [Thermoplasmata archaeon]|nr:hypothetical protein [Thermoplasmata archaeon]
MVRRLVFGVAIAVLALTPLLALGSALAAHRPLYKSSVDVLEGGEWEAHFLWLRNPFFVYTGQAYWEFDTDGGVVDGFFVTWGEFRNFREGRSFTTVTPPHLGVVEGVEGASGLSTDIPYLLVFQNPGSRSVRVTWELFAEIDWRRLGEPMPGPTLDLTPWEGSPLLARDESWEIVFEAPGHYLYYCRPHTDMTAIIEVVPGDGSAASLAVAIRDFGFHPETIQIPAGTPLVWTNHDGVEHSVQIGLLAQGIPEDPVPLPSSLAPFPWWLMLFLAPAAAAMILVAFRRSRPSGPRE